MNRKKITYLFLNGRVERIKNYDYSDDFFYGYRYLLSKNHDVKIIEMKVLTSSMFRRLLTLIDRLLRKISLGSFFLSQMIDRQNFKKIKDTDVLIATNDRLGYSTLPYLIYLRLKRKKVIMFVMGMLKIQYKNFVIKIFTNIFMKLLVKSCNNLIFLSESELKEAKIKMPLQKNKMQYVPFCIDTKFWSRQNSYQVNKKILFIGNDGKRDYKLVKDIANNFDDVESTLISRRIPKEDFKKNVNLVRTSWKSDHITDSELKRFYQEVSLVFIPLVESLQPSGQSVALQAMAMGVPVMISDTPGFWDRENLINNKNIFLVNCKTVDDWTEEIKKVLEKKDLLKDISKNARLTVEKHYDKNLLFKKLEELIE